MALQYCRYPLPTSDQDDEITVISPHIAAVCLGTSRGILWLLDGLEGSRSGGVRVEAHGGAVNGVSWDAAGLYVGSCGADGNVVVHGRRSRAARISARQPYRTHG